MIKESIIIILILSFSVAQAQFEVDKPFVLNGTLGSDRQVSGLGQPVEENALISVSALRSGAVNYATAIGTNNLQVNIEPALGDLVAGTMLNLFITNNNSGPVSITVNSLSSVPLYKNISNDLAAFDIMTGQIISVIYDGSAFQLLSGRSIERRECPVDMAEVNDLYCIEIEERDTLHFHNAATICGDLDRRICSWGEWHGACQDNSISLNNMIGNWEWTNTTSNADQSVRIVGSISCTISGNSPAQPTPARNFRCCLSR